MVVWCYLEGEKNGFLFNKRPIDPINMSESA